MPIKEISDSIELRRTSHENEIRKCLFSNYFLDPLVKAFNDSGLKNRHRYISACGQYIYHMGIIDYLQAYDAMKRAENFVKVWFK